LGTNLASINYRAQWRNEEQSHIGGKKMVSKLAITRTAMVAMVLLVLAGSASALTLGFEPVQPVNSTSGDLAQVNLSAHISAVSRIYFAFHNDSQDATVGEIYFEDTLGLLSDGVVESDLSTGT
jgi:hypothetical protein